MTPATMGVTPATEHAMRVRIHVTPSQRRALTTVVEGAPDADLLRVADFTATFGMADPIGWLEARMAEWPRGAFPRASLHGVARKLSAAIRSQGQPDLRGHTVTTEANPVCCYGEHYADPGPAYTHEDCGRLLKPWGDVHEHPLCICYGDSAEKRIPLILRRATALLNTPQGRDLPAAKAIMTAVNEVAPEEMRQDLPMKAVRAVDSYLFLDTTPGALAVFASWERKAPHADVVRALENTAARLIVDGEA